MKVDCKLVRYRYNRGIIVKNTLVDYTGTPYTLWKLEPEYQFNPKMPLGHIPENQFTNNILINVKYEGRV